MITITLPDGAKKAYAPGTTCMQVAKSISEGLARVCVAAKIDDIVVDLSTPLQKDCNFKLLKFDDPQGMEVFRHSSAHLLAHAVLELFPAAKPTIGPVVEEGFYYDFDHAPFSEEDLARIEKRMQEIAERRLDVSRLVLNEKEAKEIFKDNKYKLEIISAKEGSEVGERITAYKQGDFVDLCRGPHVPNTSMIKAIKLTKLAAAYWRGDQKNAQLQRIYGISFPERKQLTAHLEMLEEAKRRDHRRIGKELELFHTCDEIGPGLVLWLPNGNIIKEQLERWAKETEAKHGYVRVTTPVITKEGLFHTSEHLPHYKDSMYPPMQLEGENYYIKPMNCPFHHMIYKARARSYRELPLRLAEYGWCHRYEQSGAITGLMRVRGMQMNDAHIYCTKEQAVEEFLAAIKLHEYYYKILGITEYWMELALRNPKSDKYHGDDAMWKEAEALMLTAMERSGVKYIVQHDGAAFYGPKIDFQIKSVIGRTFTASTNQIDLFMPKKFDLTYMAEDGSDRTCVVIHRAPLGTHERFIGFLIEHFAGRFPLWLAPTQVRIATIADRHNDFALTAAETLRAAGLRVDMDLDGSSLNKKIRDAQIAQVNYIAVIGDKEVAEKSINVRTREMEQLGTMPLQAFEKMLIDEVASKALPRGFVPAKKQ